MRCFAKAPAAPFEQRWSVWASGFRRIADHRRQCNDRGQYVDQQYLRHGGWRRLPHFAVYGCGFRAGPAAAPISTLPMAVPGIPTCSRPAHLFAMRLDRPISQPRWLMAGRMSTTNRTVTVAGLDQLRAQFNANAFSGRLEGGYRFVAPWVAGIGITPYAAGQFTTIDLPAYAEQAVIGTNNIRTGLRRQKRHRSTQRTRHPHRQVLCGRGWRPDIARPFRLGA